jgi:hypothetical protein
MNKVGVGAGVLAGALLSACTINLDFGTSVIAVALPDGGSLDAAMVTDGAGARPDSGGGAHDGGSDASGPTDAMAPPGDGAAAAGPVENGIAYHGGKLMTGATKVYLIWYGDWSKSLAQGIVVDWASSIGATPWYAINTTYSDMQGTPVKAAVSFGGQAYDTGYSRGKSLGDADVALLVEGAISGHKLPKDPDGVYFVLTAADVDESSGFCSAYCGYHWYSTVSGTRIKYAFVGNPARCPKVCEPQSVSPNFDPAADSMASIMSHELAEAVTDPEGTGWYEGTDQENGDKCASTWGATQTTNKGALYNMSFGGRSWFIQQNWVNRNGGYCALSL